jgi:signal transduction histidine kinase
MVNAGRLSGRARAGVRVLREDLFRAPVLPMPPVTRRGWPRRTPHALLAGLALVLVLAGLPMDGEYDLTPWQAAVLASAQAGSVLLALYRPLAAWWVSLAAFAVLAERTFPPADTGALWPWTATGLWAYTAVQLLIALRVRTRITVETTAIVLLLTALVETQGTGAEFSHSFLFAVVLFTVAAVVGVSLRGRREARTELRVQEGRTAEERARRTLLEERSRIARELHDVVAHHMSVISIQAEAAPYRVPDPPAELTRSFGVIRENAVEALNELRRVLGVLRAEEPASGGPPPPDAPQPSLARIGDLVANVRAAGLEAAVSVTGTPGPLPQGVELSAYRIVQEALSNALRHAPGARVEVTVAHGEDGVGVRVVNTAPDPGLPARGAPGAGHGLLGMRERTTMLGGELAVGPTPQGGYEVAAFLPRTAPDRAGQAGAGPAPGGTGGDEGEDGR